MEIEVSTTHIEDVLIVKHEIAKDTRGFFMECFREDIFTRYNLPTTFVQMNSSGSYKGVVRGLHFQWDPPMGKLIWVSRGEGFLVAVDIRRESPTMGQHVSITSNEENRISLWAPAGFARGFVSISKWVEIQYLATGTYNKDSEGNILWNDPDIGIKWPVNQPILSERDKKALTLTEWLTTQESFNFSI